MFCRDAYSAESCLRRAQEALLDLGRHLLAKIFGEAVAEYKRIAEELDRRQVLAPEAAHRLRVLAGYRNRMVHLHHDVTKEELYSISASRRCWPRCLYAKRHLAGGLLRN